jgi:hypothetical protein
VGEVVPKDQGGGTLRLSNACRLDNYGRGVGSGGVCTTCSMREDYKFSALTVAQVCARNGSCTAGTGFRVLGF